jgi:hypothetical protein
VRSTVAQPCVVVSGLAKTSAASLTTAHRDGLAYDLKRYGLVTWTVTNAFDATLRVQCTFATSGACMAKRRDSCDRHCSWRLYRPHPSPDGRDQQMCAPDDVARQMAAID